MNMICQCNTSLSFLIPCTYDCLFYHLVSSSLTTIVANTNVQPQMHKTLAPQTQVCYFHQYIISNISLHFNLENTICCLGIGMLKTTGQTTWKYRSNIRTCTCQEAHRTKWQAVINLIRNNKVIGYLPSQLNLCTHGKR